MKKIFLISLILLSSNMSQAQDFLRLTYLYSHKMEAEGRFRNYEMQVDYDGRTSYFYNELSYRKDSLNVIAFDKNGDIADQDAYAKSTRLPATTNESSIIDFADGTFTQRYDEVAIFNGTMPIVLPQWKVNDEEESELSGYKCKTADGDFLGRHWTIYFTEEIPISAGPWLLWGAPGLIISATDSENLIKFRLTGVSKVNESRLDKSRACWNIRESRTIAKVYTLKMKDMERMHTRYRRDVEYFNTIHGCVGGYDVDRNGTRTEMPKVLPYIPLIADDFWADR